MASLEAASIPAFTRLARELRHHQAPAALVQRSRSASRDEARHAKIVDGLARGYGTPARIRRLPVGRIRSLCAVARENAVEGCVRETIGALVASWQATHASDLDVRRAMRVIAVDEARHAELAFAIAHWIERRLTTRARAGVERAKKLAIHSYLSRIPEPPSELARTLGLPTRRQTIALWTAFERELDRRVTDVRGP